MEHHAPLQSRGEEKQGISAVVIGGGTGTFTVLRGLKPYVSNLSAIVNMVDDGGSTGILRDELGVLPPGDIRQCLVALSEDQSLMRELMNYRYDGGALEGHAFGNLFLTALEKITGSFDAAVKAAERILAIDGRVIPVTTEDVRLGIRFADGRVVMGERMITTTLFDQGNHPELFLEPIAHINPEAAAAISQADLIIFGPGNVYSSLLPTLLVKGMSDALIRAPGKKIYICNLVNKRGQTDGYCVHDFVHRIETAIGQPIFHYVVYNNTPPSTDLQARYSERGDAWVDFDLGEFVRVPYTAVGAPLISADRSSPPAHDVLLERNLIRHDSDILARTIMQIYFR